MLKKATQRLAGALPAQARGMGHAAGPRITARSERYETLWGMEHGPDKAFSAKEADLWKKFTFVAVPIACALGEAGCVICLLKPSRGAWGRVLRAPG